MAQVKNNNGGQAFLKLGRVGWFTTETRRARRKALKGLVKNGGQAFLIVVIEGRGTIARLFSVVPMGQGALQEKKDVSV